MRPINSHENARALCCLSWFGGGFYSGMHGGLRCVGFYKNAVFDPPTQNH